MNEIHTTSCESKSYKVRHKYWKRKLRESTSNRKRRKANNQLEYLEEKLRGER